MKKPAITFVLISLCTCQRPNMLKISLESIKNLTFPENIKVELLVIDNDKNATAKDTIDELKKDFPITINYYTEEKRGIANARNRLLKEACNLNASHIAMLDDDEIVDKNWLLAHVNYYNQNPDAIIVSGPTYNTFEKKYPQYIEKNTIFKSSTTKKTGLKRKICASGNVFFPVSVYSESNISFDPSYVFMGGEDGDFFARAAQKGYSIIWNNDAINKELIGDSRANLKWIFQRHYYNGYSSILLKLQNNKSLIKRIFYIVKTLLILILDILITFISILAGLTAFFNVVGMVCKTKGKLDAAIKNKPLNYYQNICGN